MTIKEPIIMKNNKLKLVIAAAVVLPLLMLSSIAMADEVTGTLTTGISSTVATVLSVARRAKSIFEKSSDILGKRAFLNSLLKNPTVNGKKLCFSIASPYNLVLELADSPIWLPVQGTFRTVNWHSIAQELQFSGILGLKGYASLIG